MLDAIAKDFVEVRFKKMNGVIGILLMGSVSLGYTDDLSDVDLEVIASGKLYRKVGASCEGYEQYHGINISWEWMTFEDLESELKDWKDDIDLWTYSKSKVLYDPQHKLEKLLSKYKHYPNKIWLEKLFLYWYFATAHAPYDSRKAIQRDDLTTAQLYLNQAMEYYLALIFILNHSFVPYKKWRLKEFQKLPYKPKNYEEKLRKILTTRNWIKKEFETKQSIINELVFDLQKELLKAGILKERLENPWKFKVTYVPRT